MIIKIAVWIAVVTVFFKLSRNPFEGLKLNDKK